MKMMKTPLILLTLAASLPPCLGTVRVYPVPDGVPVSADRTLRVTQAGETLSTPFYYTPVNPVVYGRKTGNPFNSERQRAYHVGFDLTGSAILEIRVHDQPVETAVVRPASRGIRPQVANQTIRFPVASCGPLTVEINSDIKGAMHIFVNPPEDPPPDKADEDVLYFEPGFYPDVGVIDVKSNQTLYIAGGAYLQKASIKVEDARNVIVRGRGIVDTAARLFNYRKKAVPEGYRIAHSMWVYDTTNMIAEGITLLDAEAWCSPYRRDENVRIDNIKIIGADSNTDQLDIVGSRNVHVTNVFLRGHDDSVVIKTGTAARGRTCSRVLVEDSVIWTDVAHSLAVGFEILQDIHDVTFRNIDIIHCDGGGGSHVIDIANADDALVHNIHFSDIRVEQAMKGLIRMGIFKSKFSTKKKQFGRIRDIVCENITVLNGPFPDSEFRGHSAQFNIANVLIRDLVILGDRIDSPEEGRFGINRHVENLRVE